ncbi:MAG TPA: hypothetical protein PK530_13805, partial [Anaerolineales bacterium]|nr:hypothetical protein [Anaerolineales bacterium]
MTPHKLIRASIPFALGITLTILFWLALIPKETATAIHPDVSPASIQRSTTSPPADLTWINLLKTLHATKDAPDLTLSLNLNLNTQHLAGHTPLGSSITISVTREGALIANALTTPVPDLPGFFYETYLEWIGYTYGLQPGDLIWLHQAGSVVTMTVPTLNSQASSPNDTLSGLGPANASLLAYLLPYADPTASYTQTTTTEADGTYQFDWGNSPGVAPADRGFVAYTPAPNQSVYSLFVAPLLRAQLNGQEISGYATPYASVYLTVRDTNGELLSSGTAYTYDDGHFSTIDYERFSEATIQPGYKIFADVEGQTFSMTAQALTIALDAQNSEITGETSPNSPVQVIRFDGPLDENPYSEFWILPPDEIHAGTANASGEFTFPVSLQPGNYGAVAVTGADDFITFVRFNMPFIRVFQREPYDYRLTFITGQVNQFNTPIEIAIQGPSGYLKDIFSVETQPNGFFVGGEVENNDLSISTGDVITVSTENGVETSMHVPTFTVETDAEADTVSGQAPPDSQLTISLSDYWYDDNGG